MLLQSWIAIGQIVAEMPESVVRFLQANLTEIGHGYGFCATNLFRHISRKKLWIEYFPGTNKYLFSHTSKISMMFFFFIPSVLFRNCDLKYTT